ncbi:MAG: glycosyltransferase family 39 protein [Anaerolineae bacterium]|nr:glycosyltransferase family 39 protein [Anaerolineae bacterium]
MSAWRKLPATFWQLLVVTLWGLPLITPLLKWTAVACTHDGHLHYHRVAAMRYAWENGLYFTRWLPDLAFGYGYPFFVYREPAPLYAVLLPHLLGLPLPAAENLFYALCILAGGWFMFLWARDIFGARAGIVSAVAYMSAPYVLVDALVRGNAPESLALPLLPLLLWLSRRWLLTGETRWFVTAIFSLAFLSLSHNISLLIFTPTLLVYLLALAVLHKMAWRTAVLRLALLFGLGLGMTSFYTVGAVLEMDAVTLQQSVSTRNNDFRYNFATLAEIFAPVTPEDPNLLNPPLRFRLGWVMTALGIWGALCWFWLRRVEIKRLRDWEMEQSPNLSISQSLLKEQQWHIVLMVLATAVYLFMSLPPSLFLWETLPLIDFTQFPWRFIGRAALPVALLAGVPFLCLPQPAARSRTADYRLPITNYRLRLLFFLALSLLLLEAIPNLYPNECREEMFPTILTVHQYEHETGLVGVDPEGSYFPRSVLQRPTASPLQADYQTGQKPQRLDITALPEGAELTTAVAHPRGVTVQLTSPQPFTATYLSFAFPGWQAFVDGTAVPITPSQPDGLITFPVPAGSHTIEVKWGSTPLRSLLIAVSILAFMSTILLVVIGYWSLVTGHRPSGMSHRPLLFGHQPLPVPPRCLPPTAYRSLITHPLLLLALTLFISRTHNPLRRPAPPPVTATAVLSGGELRLDGFNLSTPVVESGGTFDVDMAWTALDYPRAHYQTNIWLATSDGLLWSEKETFRPRLYEDAPPTIFWQPGQWAWDSREVQVLPGTPPGVYDLVLTLFDRDTLQPVTLLEATGPVVGPTVVLGQIEVTATDDQPVFVPQFPLTAAIRSLGWTLLGYNQDRDEAAPGGPFLLTLFWERNATPADSFSLTLHDEAGQTVREWELPFTPTAVSTLTLPNHSRIRSQHLLRLPVDLADGRYQWRIENDTVLGDLTIHAPERVLTPPAVDTAVSIPFSLPENSSLATLVGYSIVNLSASSGQSLQSPISLVWRADAIFPASYRVFVHLVDETGQIIAQADGEPANWTRPTTGWLPGEYISDTHILTLPAALPPGPLTLQVGLYDPQTGYRLQTGTADYVAIPAP